MPDGTDVVAYTEGGFHGTLTDLKNALQTSGGQVFFGFDPGTGNLFDFLFVYNNAAPNANGANDVSIADIQFEGASSTFNSGTASMDITAAHNLITLTNITGGAGSLFAEYLAHHSNIFLLT
jgi:hypothetical protein